MIKRKGGRITGQAPLHIMLLPNVVMILIFAYLPMVGIKIAFEDFIPAKGLFGPQDYVGWKNFSYALNLPEFWAVTRNTLFIAVMKIIFGLIVPVTVSLLLNEIKAGFPKRTIQTIIYLPHFISWVLLAGIMIDILAPSTGIFNVGLKTLGFSTIDFLGNPAIFPWTIIWTDVWKGFGFGTIIYLASISSIDPGLYESALIDGASRLQQAIYITLPGMASIIILVTTLSLANVLNAGFDQIFNLLKPTVYSTGDIIDTFVYRLGLINARYSLSSAIGLMRSAVGIILISTSYTLAYKFANYRIV